MDGAAAGLWAAVIGLGAYHGLNPAMGWPLAVANGLMERRGGAVLATALPLGLGHLLAMAVVLLPFAWLAQFAAWNHALRSAAGVLVLGYGLYRLVQPRHPRVLARVRPTQLVAWSFLMATAHGAALMLLPIALGLCSTTAPDRVVSDAGHAAFDALAASGVATAALVAGVHTVVMLLSGLALAWTVYRWLGLGFLRRSWLDLDRLWAASLVVTGVAGLAAAAG